MRPGQKARRRKHSWQRCDKPGIEPVLVPSLPHGCGDLVMRAVMLLSVMLLLALLGFMAPAHAQSREVTGQAGILGEWELTATVTRRNTGGTKEFVGPLSLKHVGICTVDGPEEKKGELRLRMSEMSTRVMGTLLIDGSECTYNV